MQLESDPDFIAIRRFDYSLANLLERYPNGAPDTVIAAALMLKDQSSVKTLYNRIVKKLREKMSNSGIDMT